MKILVTNEDGIFSPGVIALSELLMHFGEVTVVCPQNTDFMNHPKTSLNRPLSLKKVQYSSGIEAYTINGTPTECVKLGIEELTDGFPDFVFCGINLGANIGRDAFKSPSIRAIEEAYLHDIPAAALAIDELSASNINFSKIKELLYDMLTCMMSGQLPNSAILNINIPNDIKSNIKGMKILPLDTSVSKYKFKKLVSNDAEVYYFLEDVKNGFTSDGRTDLSYLQLNYITISPLVLRNTCEKDLKVYQNWLEETKI